MADLEVLEQDQERKAKAFELPPLKQVVVFGSTKVSDGSYIWSSAAQAAVMLAEYGFRIACLGDSGFMDAMLRGGRNGFMRRANTEEQVADASALLDYRSQLDGTPGHFERQIEVYKESDAFIALPGGYTTMLEVMMVIRLMKTGEMPWRPLILVGKGWRRAMDSWKIENIEDGYLTPESTGYYSYADWPVEAANTICKQV